MKALLRLLYAAAMGVTLALLLFWEHLEYIYKREFALSNAALLALDAVVLALLAAACGLTEDELAEIWRVQKEETE